MTPSTPPDPYLISIIEAAFDPMQTNSVPNRLARIESQLLTLEQDATRKQKEADARTTWRIAWMGVVATVAGGLLPVLISVLFSGGSPAVKTTHKHTITYADIRYTNTSTLNQDFNP